MAFKQIVLLLCLLVLLQNRVAVLMAILDPIDFLALQSVRKSLDDLPGSNFFESWDFTADPCNFAGVYCDSNRVIALNLGDPRAGSPGLTGRIDPAIGNLTSLVEFSVVPGRIIGSLPSSISKLKELRFLAISQNFLSRQIPASVGELVKLKTLDLSYNSFSGEIPSSIGLLPELSNVMLCHNHLCGSVPSFVSQGLNRVDLKHNDLSGSLGPTTFSSSVKYLSLSWNRLTGSVNGFLSRLDQLNYLDLSVNQFSGPIPGRLFTLPTTNLRLQRNMFSGAVQPLDQVTIPTVDLSYNRLYGTISPLFSSVQNLYLNNNRFTGQVPRSFVDRVLASSLQILYLQHNFLTGIQINPTADIPTSSSMCLQYNCMVLPVQTPCPLKVGKAMVRPTAQCVEWRG